MNKPNLEKSHHYRALNYAIVLKEAGAKYHLAIPELGLYASGTNLDETNRDLKLKKENYFTALIEAGLEDDIPLPSALVKRDRLTDEIKLYLIKTAITLCVALVFAALIAASSYSIIRKTQKKITAAVDVPPRISEIRLNKYKNLLERLQPFLSATREAFELNGKSRLKAK